MTQPPDYTVAAFAVLAGIGLVGTAPVELAAETALVGNRYRHTRFHTLSVAVVPGSSALPCDLPASHAASLAENTNFAQSDDWLECIDRIALPADSRRSVAKPRIEHCSSYKRVRIAQCDRLA